MSPEECSPAVMFTRYFIAIPEDPSPSASIPGQNANKLFTFSPSETVLLYSHDLNVLTPFFNLVSFLLV